MPPQSADQPSPSLKQTLRNRQLNRNRPSCLPCRERKVRCNKQIPCSTCSKRGHPDLCLYNGLALRPPHNHHAGEAEMSSTAAMTHNIQSQHGESLVPQSPINNTLISTKDNLHSKSTAKNVPGSPNTDAQQADSSLLDENSLLSIAGRRSSATPEDPNRTIAFQSGILPLLGASAREQAPVALLDTRAALYRSFPDNQLVLELFEVYRVRVHPFNGITYNLDEIEKQLCVFLSDRETGTVDNAPQSLHECQWTCLLHAILASGAQFSDLPSERRSPVSQNHSK